MGCRHFQRAIDAAEKKKQESPGEIKELDVQVWPKDNWYQRLARLQQVAVIINDRNSTTNIVLLRLYMRVAAVKSDLWAVQTR